MLKHSTHQEHSELRKRRRAVVSCTECHRRKQKCDRQHPCCHCTRRSKQDLCFYEPILSNGQDELSTSNHTHLLETNNDTNTLHLDSPVGTGSELPGREALINLQELGFSTQAQDDSLRLLRLPELSVDRNINLTECRSVDQRTLRKDIQHKYTEIIRRLPPKTFVNILVQTFFTLVNWQYDLIDVEIFQEQLTAWGKVSYSNLQEDLTTIAPEILVFPALLLQVLAHALLVHSPQDQTINGLVIVAGMTYHDLGTEYSTAGADILLLLGKESMTTATVQAGLLRASFLKSMGNVVEAWHTLGTTIRDAQEIGLHTGRARHRTHLHDAERKSDPCNTIGHKIWVVLHLWDAHMAVVLGRPMVTNLQLDSFALTIGDAEKRQELFSHWQTENELPRPFDVIMAGYNVAYRYFQEIYQLECRDVNLRDYATVEGIHAAIISNLELLPSWCRLEDPSTRFEEAHGCRWLPAAREGLYSLIHLVLLSLHRPHIFAEAKSRAEVLKAGLSILSAQERLFQQTEPHRWNLFSPVYASFDAIVLIAVICLVFPDENREQQGKCFQAMGRGIHRLAIIGRSNRMARSAHSVVSALHSRLIHRLGDSGFTRGASTNSSSSSQVLSGSQMGPPTPTISLDAILPPRPTHDLFYDHLSGVQVPTSTGANELNMDSLVRNTSDDWNFEIPNDLGIDSFLGNSVGGTADNWNFEGTFSSDSFWNFLN